MRSSSTRKSLFSSKMATRKAEKISFHSLSEKIYLREKCFISATSCFGRWKHFQGWRSEAEQRERASRQEREIVLANTQLFTHKRCYLCFFRPVALRQYMNQQLLRNNFYGLSQCRISCRFKALQRFKDALDFPLFRQPRNFPFFCFLFHFISRGAPKNEQRFLKSKTRQLNF